MSNGTGRWARLFFFTGSMLLAALGGLVTACGSDDEEGSSSSATAPPDYTPVDAAAQNPLPPGAGPRPDGGTITPPTPVDAGRDTSAPMDVNVPESSPADTGAADGTVG